MKNNHSLAKTKSIIRCHWCNSDPLYITYHDQEWGVPVYDDQKLFEMLILECFQAGLSWITILRKREDFRKAFANFDAKKISRFTEDKIEKLMLNPNIIRNRAKICSTINNAKIFLQLQKEFSSFSNYLWQFTQHKILRYPPTKITRTTSPAATALAKDLKKRGFKFMGPTTSYAFMQAIGMINDHETRCFKATSLK